MEFLLNSEVREIRGDTIVKSVVLQNRSTNELKELQIDGIFIQAGEEPNIQFLREVGITTDEGGYVMVDSRQRTNIQGVFAAGDVTHSTIKQVGTAVGQAIVAATEAFRYTEKPYYYKS